LSKISASNIKSCKIENEALVLRKEELANVANSASLKRTYKIPYLRVLQKLNNMTFKPEMKGN
jgi:hypothetical protein